MNDILEIIGEKIEPGTRKPVMVKTSEFYTGNPVRLPIVITHGKEKGPKIFITAAVHGDEINGTEIVRRLNAKLDPEQLSGTVICIPIVNISGFYSMQRKMQDGRDLNRSFPGIEKGSSTSRIAKLLFEEIISKCDYGIDLHTPRMNRFEIPHTEGDTFNEAVFRMARAFGLPIIIHTKGPEKSLQYTATEAGVPTIVYSAGEILRFHENITQKGFEGILNVMHEVGMIDFETTNPDFSVIVQESRAVHTKKGGILHIKVLTGQLVYEKDPIGNVLNPFGFEVEDIQAQENGLIICVSTNPLVHPGDEVCSYVMLDKSLGVVENAIKNNARL
ncbi:MAG: succinylglutamate desuccinylase/aspartoacylase family protein [bacterium]|nr:succinylglutamate desuccinylase/aspartoacylase family protein [bacterium]